jgi:3-methyladenine DNA glycosylase/8-oxoguanine DNA glycosylase
MPALSNPRHEAFAQALFAGLAGETRVKRAQSTAYLTAYPNCSNGNSAEAAASRLLRRVKPILDRVLELQAEQAKRTQRKIDISRDRLARRLDLASTMAEQQQNVAGIVASEMGIAKVFGIDQGDKNAAHSFKDAQSMNDIGERLLRSVGLPSPSAEAINEAIQANDAFVARLEEIRDHYS